MSASALGAQSPQQPARTGPPAPAAQAIDGPNEQALGIPRYPGSQFLHQFDAGGNQMFYLFGTTDTFATAVAFYQQRLKKKGEELFASPATWLFEIQDRDEWAFPVGVTIRDHTAGGLHGYPNHRPGAAPASFPTVIVITSWPGGAPPRKQ